MAATKMTMLLELLTKPSTIGAPIRRVAGWSESWYVEGTASESQITAFNQLCRLRANLLGIGGRVKGQRFQQVDPAGPSTSFGRVYISTAHSNTDTPNMALQIVVRGTGLVNVRRAHLRGIPDDSVEEGEYSPTQEFANNLATFKLALSNFRFRAKDQSQPKVIIDSISAAGIVTTSAAILLAVNDYVDIIGTTTTLGSLFRGRFQVKAAPDATHFTLYKWPGLVCTNGKAQKFVAIYPGFLNTNILTNKISSRRVGRPFDQFRGRASRRN